MSVIIVRNLNTLYNLHGCILFEKEENIILGTVQLEGYTVILVTGRWKFDLF